MRTNKYGPHSNIFQIAHNLIFNFNFNSNTTSNTISTYIIWLMSVSWQFFMSLTVILVVHYCPLLFGEDVMCTVAMFCPSLILTLV